MKFLLTGSSGFLGQKILSIYHADHEMVTLSLDNLADLICDLSLGVPYLPTVDVVVHAAGKAHSVPITEMERQEFFNVNVTGTANLLKGLENSVPKSFIFVSSVAVYGKEMGVLINEDEALLAKDPYGQSKIQAERLVTDWCIKNKVICTIIRLPLIAGENPPGNLGAMITGIKKGYYFNIGRGRTRKSLVLAEDVAKIIIRAAEIGGTYNLTDSYHPSFWELSELIAKQAGKNKPLNIPYWLAKIIARAGDLIGTKAPLNSNKLKKITSDLTFDDSRARELLKWDPTPILRGFKIN
jgi:nucleoside-diphosphate-sugar epimerase